MQVALKVIPLKLPSPAASHCLVLFEEPGSPAARQRHARGRGKATGTTKGPSAPRLEAQLRRELEATKEYLQSTIEQQEATNEELRSANEEILSSNEELQSTNEELETAKEELQSTNEELTTVNEEVQHRNRELSQANNDLNNFFGSSNLPIILLGADLRIRRCTAVAEKVLKILPTDIGRPIGDLKLTISLPDLESLIGEVMDTVTPREREVQDRQGHWYLMRILPYRGDEKAIEGAVLLFIDIDSLKDVERLTALVQEAKRLRDYAQSIVETVRDPLIVLDGALRVKSASRAFYQGFHVTPQETEGRLIYELGNRQWDIPRLRELLERVLPQRQQLRDFEVTHDFPLLGRRTMLLNARQLHQGKEEEGRLILLAIEDITERVSLKEKEVLLKEIHHRVKNNLQLISSLLTLQAEAVTDPHILQLFEDSKNRIRSMALVHEKLYGTTNLSRIDMGSYIQSLVEPLQQSLPAPPVIRVSLEVQDVAFGIDTAIACGLMLNELISNAFKHAFPGRQNGEVFIGLRPASEGRFVLVVRDQGVGLPRDIDIANTESLGLRLVETLVKQLHGTMQVDREGGTTFTIQFAP